MPDHQTSKDAQALRIFDWAAGAASLRMAYYGLKLGIFRAITAHPRGTPLREIAASTQVDERYLRAWAKTAHAGGLIEYDDATGNLTMAPHMEALLLDDQDFQYQAGLVTNFAVESRLADRVEECFRSGTGIPFTDYGQEMVETIHAFSKAAYELFLPSVLLPALPEMKARLDAGGTILELGCGAGAGLISLARTFPNCTVTGLDPDATSIALARQRIEDAGLGEHVHAEEMRGEDLTSEDAFDFIYTQISLHEMDDARVVLANARRALKSDGVILITEIRGRKRYRTPWARTTPCCRTSTCTTKSRRPSRRADTLSGSSRAASWRRWRRTRDWAKCVSSTLSSRCTPPLSRESRCGR